MASEEGYQQCIYEDGDSLNWDSKGLEFPFIAKALEEDGIDATSLFSLHRRYPWSEDHVRASENFAIHHAMGENDVGVVQWLVNTFNLNSEDIASRRGLGLRVAIARGRKDTVAFIHQKFNIVNCLPPDLHLAVLERLYSEGHAIAPLVEPNMDAKIEDFKPHFERAMCQGDMGALRLICSRVGGVKHFKDMRSGTLGYFRYMCKHDREYLKDAIEILEITQREAISLVALIIGKNLHRALKTLITTVEIPEMVFTPFITVYVPAMVLSTLLERYPDLEAIVNEIR